MASPLPLTGADALIVVDLQNDFMPGGALAVVDGDAVVSLINALAPRFEKVVVTQDWHPAGHASFASSHGGAKPFTTIRLEYGQQVLWPDHCVQGTFGAALHHAVAIDHAMLILRKGIHKKVDSYSAFTEADGTTTTGLAAYLKAHGVERVFFCGLATDFCVAWSALDARKAGFETWVIEDASRAIDADGSLAAALTQMDEAGVKRIRAADLRT